MKCNQCQESLSAYYDDMLDEKEKNAVVTHLGTCSSCQKEYEQLVAILSCLNTKEETVTVPKRLHTTMLEKVAKEAQQGKVKHIGFERFAGMVAILLVGVIGMQLDGLNLRSTIANREVTAREGILEATDAAIEESSEDLSEASYKIRNVQEVEETALEPSLASAQVAETTLDSEASNETQVWQIEVTDVTALKQYLENYSLEMNIQVDAQDTQPISFDLENIKNPEGLFGDLEKQNFTKSLTKQIKEGTVVKIVVKD